MDKPLFECKITYTKEISKEYARLSFRKNKALLLGCLIFTLLMTLIGVLYAVFEEYYSLLTCGSVLFLFTFLCLLLIFVREKILQKLFYAQTLEKNNGKVLENVMQFFECKFVAENPLTGNKNEWPYSVIKHVKESRNLIVPVTNAKQALPVDKRTFTEGTATEFRSFVNAKIKQGENNG